MTSAAAKQPWIKSAGYDGLFILLPPFAILVAVWLMPDRFKHSADMPVMAWVLLVLLVDVAHVYSTLYNTYFDAARFARHKRLFLWVPVCCFLAGVMLHLVGALVFWRALAYVAVFHFVRQQYGFMRLYARRDKAGRISAALDAVAIYAATLYPLIYWHCTPGRNFNWFVNDDFIIGNAIAIRSIAGIVYALIVAAYVIKELAVLLKTGYINVPKNLVITGTMLSWYFGIVYFNGDMAFTMLNVVSHGVPYMALVWHGVGKDEGRVAQPALAPRRRVIARWYGVAIFLGSLFLLAWLEEGLWDGLIWREHKSVFSPFSSLPHIDDGFLLALLVPLLSLPQSTHYVLDGFIWRKKYA